MYVREGCRILGGYLFSASDALLDSSGGRSPTHWDSVASGGYQIDSHATRQREDLGLGDPERVDGRRVALEGFIGLHEETVPYQIPYRVMVPEGIDGLLAPVAVSASHLGYGTIRMEPVWMALGEAAGQAAALALERGERIRDVPRGAMQRELLAQGQVITYFDDVAPAGFPGFEAAGRRIGQRQPSSGARGGSSRTTPCGLTRRLPEERRSGGRGWRGGRWIRGGLSRWTRGCLRIRRRAPGRRSCTSCKCGWPSRRPSGRQWEVCRNCRRRSSPGPRSVAARPAG